MGILPPPLYNNWFLHPQSWIFSQACRCYCSGSSRARREEKTKQNGDPPTLWLAGSSFQFPGQKDGFLTEFCCLCSLRYFPNQSVLRSKKGKTQPQKLSSTVLGLPTVTPFPMGLLFILFRVLSSNQWAEWALVGLLHPGQHRMSSVDLFIDFGTYIKSKPAFISFDSSDTCQCPSVFS